jgi:DNA-binding NarL/FixJ family response regulator
VIRVAIADDQNLVRSGFVSLLEDVHDLTVVGEANNGDEAVQLARRAQPDVFLMDIRMPTVDGLEATRRIIRDPDCGNVRVIMLTTFELDEYVFAALRAGASGFLSKDLDAADLRDAIRVVASGQALLSPSVTRRVIDAFVAEVPEPKRPDRLELLTDRETDVLRLLAHGLSNHEIAQRLTISPLTAKTYVSRLLSKLGARDRAQLVALAYQHRLVLPPDPEP